MLRLYGRLRDRMKLLIWSNTLKRLRSPVGRVFIKTISVSMRQNSSRLQIQKRQGAAQLYGPPLTPRRLCRRWTSHASAADAKMFDVLKYVCLSSKVLNGSGSMKIPREYHDSRNMVAGYTAGPGTVFVHSRTAVREY